jgi:hypothetical protein
MHAITLLAMLLTFPRPCCPICQRERRKKRSNKSLAPRIIVQTSTPLHVEG